MLVNNLKAIQLRRILEHLNSKNSKVGNSLQDGSVAFFLCADIPNEYID